jgi:hypothetical protein
MDNLQIKRPIDITKINIHESWEVDYWTKELGVTRSQLLVAVSNVGVLVSDVKSELQRMKRLRTMYSFGR